MQKTRVEISGQHSRLIEGCFFFLPLLLSLVFMGQPAYAATSYDPYVAILEEELAVRQQETERGEFFGRVSDLAALPFEVLKLGVDPVLYELETHHVPRKVEWIFEKLDERGVEPKLLAGGLGRGLSLDLEVIKLLGLKEALPNVEQDNRVKWVYDGEVFSCATGFTIEKIADTALTLRTGFDYSSLDAEDFWGLGPNSVRARGSNFEEETAEFNIALDHSLSYASLLTLDGRYQHTNIGDGEDGRKNPLKISFPTLPGIDGADEVSLTLKFANDVRDYVDRPTKGHLEEFSMGFHEGVRGSDVSYFKYTVNLAFYIPLWSDRRLLALRFYGEHNDEVGGNDVPFFNKARVGGHRLSPYDGAPLRGFERNRFVDNSAVLLNLEYRYNVWDYRDYKLDAVIFWDEGQAFDEFSRFKFKDLTESFGFALRLFYVENNVVSLELARSDEDVEIYATSGVIF